MVLRIKKPAPMQGRARRQAPPGSYCKILGGQGEDFMDTEKTSEP